MEIKDLKQLDKLMKLCRRNGVAALEIDNVKFQLGPEPIKATELRRISQTSDTTSHFDPGAITVPDQITTEELTEDQRLFGSSDPSVWTTPAN